MKTERQSNAEINWRKSLPSELQSLNGCAYIDLESLRRRMSYFLPHLSVFDVGRTEEIDYLRQSEETKAVMFLI